MPVTREELLNDPHSGARLLYRAGEAERARITELATRWLAVTSPQGHDGQVQVSHAEVLEDMRRAGWRVHEPARQADNEPEAV